MTPDNKLDALISGLTEECILRVRRGRTHWEGANRGGPHASAFRTASLTKTFTAALVLLLAEEGRLSLDDSLAAHLAADICERVHVLGGAAYGPRISIAQLLRHSSGVFDYAADPDDVVIDLTASHIWDASTVATLDAITTKYARLGKTVEIVGLNQPSADRHQRLSGQLPVH